MMTTRIINDDCLSGLRTLTDASVHCCVTSPPYWGLRDYGHDGQIGLEPTPEAYVARMVEVFREVRRVLREDGTLWLNLGDSYAGGGKGGGSFEAERPGWTARGRMDGYGLKPKDLVGIPWAVAFALRADGWWLRQDIIWHKPNPMPESVRDRCTKAHEYVFLLTKSERYFYDAEAVKETSVTGKWDAMPPIGGVKHAANKFHGGGLHTGKTPSSEGTRNRRSVWTITTKPYSGAHFAVMPPDLVEPCVRAGSSERGCCPECGAPWERVVERGESDYRRLLNGASWRDMDAEALSRGVILEAGQGGQTRNSNGTVPSLRAAPVLSSRWAALCRCVVHDVQCDMDEDCRCAPSTPAPTACTVLDPFAGSGTTLAVAVANGRSAIGIELNPEYVPLIEQRIAGERERAGLFLAAAGHA